MNKIRIQIVNYKTKSYLLDCLASIVADLKKFNGEYSIAVLDNASGDNLSDIRASFPQLKKLEIYQGENNLGFGGGHNFLSRKNDAKFILLLNPDTKIIEPFTVERLIKRAVESRSQVVGPRLLTSEGATQCWDHGELHGFRAWIGLNLGGNYWHEQKKATEVAWVSGAVFLIEKKWFDDLNGFDEHFFSLQRRRGIMLAASGKRWKSHI